MTIEEAASIQYYARPGGPISQKRAQEVGEALDLLRDSSGERSAPALVEAAKATEHVCHRDFEWDDAKAGHQHRLNQARTIIRCIVFETENASGKTVQTPVFVSLEQAAPPVDDDADDDAPTMPVRRYHTREEIMADDQLRREDLEQLVSRVMTMRPELSMHEEAKPLVRELDRLHKRLEVSVPLT
jgi:hypothetical protein